MPRTTRSPVATTSTKGPKTGAELAEALKAWAAFLEKGQKKWTRDHAWALVFEWMLKDEYGNITVPACAQLAQRRRFCKMWRRSAALVKTPYDAIICWDANKKTTGKPVQFSGGLCFGEFKQAPALTILRCAGNGRMFAVSTELRRDNEEYVQGSRRFYSLCRLAQLLGGHTADWEKRLADLAMLQFRGELNVHRSQSRRLTGANNFDDVGDLRPGEAVGPRCFVERNQDLACTVMSGTDGVVRLVHTGDFISFCVDVEEIPKGKGVEKVYTKINTLVLVAQDLVFNDDDEVEVHEASASKYMLPEHAWDGHKFKRFHFKRPWHKGKPEPSHELSIALGLYALPEVAVGDGWLSSIFDHENGKYAFHDWEINVPSKTVQKKRKQYEELNLPVWHRRATKEETLKTMAKFSFMKHRYLTATCADVAPRKARGSAIRARQQLGHKSAPKSEMQDESELLLSDSDDGADKDDLDDDYQEEGATSDEDEDEAEDEAAEYVPDEDEVGEPKPKPKPKPCKRGRATTSATTADAPEPLSPEELEREFKRQALAHSMNALARWMC